MTDQNSLQLSAELEAALQKIHDTEAMLRGAEMTLAGRNVRVVELEHLLDDALTAAEMTLAGRNVRVVELEHLLGEKEKTIDSLANRVEELNAERVAGLAQVRDAVLAVMAASGCDHK